MVLKSIEIMQLALRVENCRSNFVFYSIGLFKNQQFMLKSRNVGVQLEDKTKLCLIKLLLHT